MYKKIVSSSIRANLSLLAASYSVMRPELHFLWIRNFFESCVRKKRFKNRELHNSCEERRLRKKNWFETIVKNCFYVIHYEKLKIIYQVHVEIFDCCCVEGFFGRCTKIYWKLKYFLFWGLFAGRWAFLKRIWASFGISLRIWVKTAEKINKWRSDLLWEKNCEKLRFES